MSEKKHLHTISELFAHPISRNIEWEHLIPALTSIGLLTSESNGKYDFTRNGHMIVFERSHDKVVDIAEVLKLRHFLRLSTPPVTLKNTVHNLQIVAIDHHKAIIIHDPGTAEQRIETFHSNLTKGRILHKTKHSPTFGDENPVDSAGYFDSIIKSMMKSQRIVILSHGTGSSSAGERLFDIIKESYPKIMDKIVAIMKCDLEAMTLPEVIELGVETLNATAERIA
jgi:hypothetical protein